MPQKLVAVAMSGGADSSVAAAVLKKQGYQVFGVTMLLYSEDRTAEHAQLVASKLAIPHYMVDFSELFGEQVITPFCTEYGQGRTPNPCITCNRYLKFDALLHKARELGADFMATGHYARVEPSPEGYRLLRGIDGSKDQSYFLYTLGQEQLRYLLLPIGYLQKAEVSRLAGKLGFADAIRNESQDICFIPNSDYHSFIKEHVPSQPGDITDTNGKVLGRHKGLAYYTVGQRKGLGLPSDKRLYVLRLDAASNRLVVGSQNQLFTSRLSTSRLSWILGKAPQETSDITAKVRYKSPEVGVNLYINGDTAEARFAQPQWAIAPGQSIVFYQGEVVLGGGVIEASGLMERNEPDKDSIQTVLC
jgi:tRNA-specific 2-thiouridylase